MILLDENALNRALEAKKAEGNRRHHHPNNNNNNKNSNNSYHQYSHQTQDGYHVALLDSDRLNRALQSRAEQKRSRSLDRSNRSSSGNVRTLPKRKSNKTLRKNDNVDRRGNLQSSNSFKSNSSGGGETHSLTSASHPTMSVKSFSSNSEYDSDVASNSSTGGGDIRRGRQKTRDENNKKQQRSKSEPRNPPFFFMKRATSTEPPQSKKKPEPTTNWKNALFFLKTSTPAEKATHTSASQRTPIPSTNTTQNLHQDEEGEPSFFKQHIEPVSITEPQIEQPAENDFFQSIQQQQQQEQQQEEEEGRPRFFKQYINPVSIIQPQNDVDPMEITFIDNMGGQDAVESIMSRFYEQARTIPFIIQFFNRFHFEDIGNEFVTLGNMAINNDVEVLQGMVPFHYQLIENGVDMDRLAELWTSAYESNWLESDTDDSRCLVGPSRAVFNMRGIEKVIRQHERSERRKQREEENKRLTEVSAERQQEINEQRQRRREIMKEKRKRRRARSSDTLFLRFQKS